MRREIHTIGHSTRDLTAFLGLLGESSIALVADVRRFPGSRRYPQYNHDALESELERHAIRYKHFPALGGRRSTRSPESPNTGWRVAAFNAFADYMATPEFQAGLEELTADAEAAPTVIMCSEAVPWRCHRRLIADALVVSGWTVRDIIGPRKVEVHTLTDFARVSPAGEITYPADPLFPAT